MEVVVNEPKKSIFKGARGVHEVISRALSKYIYASIPVMETRYDLILDDDGELYRTQVKFCDRLTRDDDAVIVCLRTKNYDEKNNWRQVKTNKTYSDDEIDVVIAYIPKLQKFAWLPSKLFNGKTQITLRFSNLKRKTTRYLDDFLW
jgi:hypothetical protein